MSYATSFSDERSRIRALTTASQAFKTAPPDIHVCLLADVEPADPIEVSTGRIVTSDTPNVSSTIWVTKVTKPCPTSTQADLIRTSPSEIMHRASEKSSNPSENIKFLIDAAYPTPLFTWDLSVVLPVPPGKSKSPLSIGLGRGYSAREVRTSLTGAVPVISCPVINISPVFSAFINLNSTGSRDKAFANLSICASAAKQVWTFPKPRIAPHGGLFVLTPHPSIRALGTR